MIILGCDPGETTGLCALSTDTLDVAFKEVPGGLKGLVDYLGLDPWAHEAGDMVVMEDFILDGRTPKPNITPLLIKGWLQAVAHVNGHETRFRIQRNTYKALATNEVLKRAGLYPPRGQVGGGHAIDALRHVVAYCVKANITSVIERVFPREEAS